MAAPNLTRTSAEQRAALLSVNGTTIDYRIELDLTDGAGRPGEREFGMTTTVRFDCAEPGASSWIDLVAASVESAVLNGTELDVSGYREDDGIALSGLAARNELVVRAQGRYMNTGEGLHRFVDPVDKSVYLYSQFETADAKRMFACFDQPDLKGRYTLTVSAAPDWKVISNAPVVQSSETASGAVSHTFATSEIFSTYLVALIAGPYADWHDEHRDENGAAIPLGIYCRSSLAEHMDADRLFRETKQGFDFYHANFGVRYPFGKYDQLFVPEFNAGAMENAGAVTFLEEYVFRSRVTNYLYERRAETVLHELAHMWFGDLVTMRWWDDLWLNESFATWASVLCQAGATDYTNAWTTFANVEKSWAYRQDMLPSTHPVAADIPDLHAVEVNFDGITYAKGASILKQLVAYVGLEPFMAGLRDYFEAHAWGNATFSDLVGALEKSSGRDLSDWGAQWLRTTGLNLLRPEFTVAPDGTFETFTVFQGGARPGAGELRTHRLAVGVYDDDGHGNLVRTKRVEIDVEAERTEVPELVGVPRGKLVLVNDDDLTYGAVRLDPESLAVVVDRIADITEPLPRTLCWSAAWEMTREAEMKARDFATLVAGGVGRDSETGVVQRLLMQAQTAVGAYAEPSWATEHGWPSLTGTLLDMARSAEPGSDGQLVAVNALTGAVLDDATLDAMAGWLDGSDVLDGLTVDTDLRWRLLHALVAHGRAGEDEIAAEHDRDRTSKGERQAEQARALVPTAEAKATAWERAVHDDDLPNAVSDSIIYGFSHPAQPNLLTGYTERYFAEVADVWARRTSERAQSMVIGLFPAWAVDQATVDAADAFLADESHPPALRRLVTEGRAGVVRSLAAREFDRA